MTRYARILAWCLVLASSALAAADWNEWRGPQRNGVVEKCPPLAANWPAEGPKRVWLSDEKVPSGEGDAAGGFASVVVADGRVYCPFILARTEKLATRTLTEIRLIGLGWSAKKLPADLAASVEQVRLSEERQSLKDDAAISKWALAWHDTKLTAEQKKEFGAQVIKRLKGGKAAIDPAIMDKLEAIKDKPFAGQAELDAWYAANGIEGEVRKTIQLQFPATETYRDTVLLCADAATGKTLWKKVFPGGPILPMPSRNVPACSTPCVVNGKLYVLGTDGMAFCLDAKTGEKVWSALAGNGREQKHCSFLVLDGVAIVPAGPLTGFDAENGKVLWSDAKLKDSAASPVIWREGGKTLAVVRADGKVVCVDPKTGAVAWTLNEGTADMTYGGSTPAVEVDRMAVSGQRGVRLFKLSADKAEPLWSVDCPMDYCTAPTIFQGYVYVFGRGGATCIDMESGKVAWQDKQLKAGAYNHPLVADGKFFLQGCEKEGTYGDGSLFLLPASAEKGEVVAKAPLKQALCTTPAIVDGRIYCRLANGLACYDLRK